MLRIGLSDIVFFWGFFYARFMMDLDIENNVTAQLGIWVKFFYRICCKKLFGVNEFSNLVFKLMVISEFCSRCLIFGIVIKL